MPNPNAVVSRVVRIELVAVAGLEPTDAAAEERGRLVVLEGDRRVRLDPGDPRSAGYAQILDGLSKLGTPVYLEVDPVSSAVTRLLIPLVTRVLSLRPTEEGLDVDVQFSHARHLLRRDTQDFASLEATLRQSLDSRGLITLTESDSHEIIDVRAYTPGPEGPPIPFPPPGPREFLPRARPWYRRIWPWRWLCWICCWLRCVPLARATQAFNAMAATSCDPMSVPPPCIPFLYPDDGCWARAHEMCRLMINTGLRPRKVWIQGNLRVNTRNNPACFVRWGWHVAPTLCVRGPTWFQVQDMVIDPSLFGAPVSEAAWKGVQGDPNATLTHTDASVYDWGPEFDPTYSKTDNRLAFYRLQLQLRAVQSGPPPYANCP